MIKEILSQQSHWQINKKFARKFGLDCALILSDLIDKKSYFNLRGELLDSEWFFNTSDNIKADTGITYYKQKKAITKLIKNGFVETEMKGMPCKQYFKINEEAIYKFFLTENTTPRDEVHSIEETKEQVLKKLKNKHSRNLKTCSEVFLDNNKNKTNKNKNNNKSKPKSFKSFTREDLCLQIEEYASEYPNRMIQDFCDYWSEPTASGKIRLNLEKAWDIKRRLKTWLRRSGSQYSNDVLDKEKEERLRLKEKIAKRHNGK